MHTHCNCGVGFVVGNLRVLSENGAPLLHLLSAVWWYDTVIDNNQLTNSLIFCASVPPTARSSDAENLLPSSESAYLSSSAGSKRHKTYDECSGSHQRTLRADARVRYEFAPQLVLYP